MDIEKIAYKLEPLIPDKVQAWLRVRDTANPELKSLVDKQIVATAQKLLGDYRKKLLLSLPPEHLSKGSIGLGTVLYETQKWPFGISSKELLQNLVIFGRSGAGKTNVAARILEQLDAKGIPWLFLDWKRTARHLLPRLKGKVNVYTPGRSLSPFAFNPFIKPPGLDTAVYAHQLVDVIADAFTLGDGSKSILQKAILTCYQQYHGAPQVGDIIHEVKNMPSKDRIRGWKISALRALDGIAGMNMATDQTSQLEMARRLTEESSIIELDGLGQNAKKFLIPLLYQWVYQVKLDSPVREKLNLVVFIEEAHHVMYGQAQRSKETLVETLLRQAREIGIATVVIDQQPSLISSVALGNCYTSICLNQKNPSDINKAAALSLVDNDDRNGFSMLPVGQGVVKLQDRWRRPVLLQFPLVEVQKGRVSDDLLARYSALNRHQSTGSRRRTSGQAGLCRIPRIPLFDRPLQGPAFTILEDVLKYPDDGIRIRYQRLGLGVGTGNRLKLQLIDQGWMEDQVVELGRTRKLLLRVTPQGKEALGLEAAGPERPSLVHEYWKRFYAQRFQEQGYRVRLEAPRARASGRADVSAIKDGKTTAIEIETGKSDVVRNVKQDLASGFDKVLMVATDKSAFEKIERSLAQAGLLIAGRVEIILRDRFRLSGS
jgi:Helicase HerA, central domain